MRIYIIKHALTKGILATDAEPGPFEDFVTTKGGVMYHRSDWASSPREARVRAEQIKRKKIASLEKQIEKLERMDFVSISEIDI